MWSFFDNILLKLILSYFIINSAKSSTVIIFLFLIILNFFPSKIRDFFIYKISENSKKIILFFFIMYFWGIYFIQKNDFTEIIQFLNGRIEIWTKYIEYFIYNLKWKEKIIGVGWNINIIKQYGNFKHPHNEYLRILLEFGIIGFSYLIYIINISLRRINNIKKLKILMSIYVLSILDINLIIGISSFALYLLLYISKGKSEL